MEIVSYTNTLEQTYRKFNNPGPFGGTPESSTHNVDPMVSNYIVLVTIIVVAYIAVRVYFSIRADKKSEQKPDIFK
ncbi:MAG: hypothetical protein R3279_12915 [Putridiphycobacter sp.]|nr:hypothetical protein [Putridiphycobacter sp.]